GEFEMKGLDAGEYFASLSEAPSSEGGLAFAVAMDGDEARPDDVPVTIESGHVTRKDLQQKPRAAVSGVVKDGGKPAPGVRVSLHQKGAPPVFGPSGVKTDEHGAFTIEKVAPGDYSLVVDPPGGALPIRKPLTLAPRAEQRVTIDLPTGAIEG